jgi:predicted Ser/Thr protein kinase
MSSVREPAIDVQARTMVSTSDRQAAEAATGEDRTQAAGVGAGGVVGPLAELEPGAVIARYRIVGKLGAGGMGVVYRAYDAQLDREVALKLLRVGEDGTEGRTRMLREAKAAAKIRHANVVTVYDAGEAFGRVFIAMELIDGVTLKAFFRGKQRGWRAVIEVMLGAGEGLAAAHAAGLVHRDFKPDNVLVESGGRVRVLDFGLARSAIEVEAPTVRSGAPAIASDAPPVMRTLTQTGTLVGTPAYMAPEQHLSRGVDARTDQFAFCVTCFECLFGERPFAGDTQAELTMNVLDGRMQAPRERGDTPAEVLAALHRGMSVHPADRWPALADLLAELRAIVVRHQPRDRKGLLIAAGLLLPALVGALVYVSEAEHDAGPQEQAQEQRREQPSAEEPVEVTKAGDVTTPVATPAGLFLGKPQRIDAPALAELIGQILPAELKIAGGPEGLYLTGDGAIRWKQVAEGLVSTLDNSGSHSSSSPLVTQLQAPERAWVGVFALASEDFTARVKAIRKLPGVTLAGESKSLGLVLTLGDAKSPDAVKKLLMEPKAAKVRGWYFINDSMSDRREPFEKPYTDFPTLAACEAEEMFWFQNNQGRCKVAK